MNQAAWSPDEREQYADLLDTVWATPGLTTGERAERFLGLLDDALQARRFWAGDVQRHLMRTGAAAAINKHAKATRRLAVAHDGQLLNRPRVGGVRRARPDGKIAAQQTLFDYFTFEELEAKNAEYQRQIGSYEENTALVLRLLTLREKVPGARTPAEACERLGISVAAFLTEDAA